MKLHILKFAHSPNPQGIPAQWPAFVRELPDDAATPDPPWIVMTADEYAAYLSEHQPAYDAWAATQPVTEPAAPALRWETRDFLLRFTPGERAAIRASSDLEVQDFIDLLRTSPEVVADHPLTLMGMGLLVDKGLVTTARKDAILSAASSP